MNSIANYPVVYVQDPAGGYTAYIHGIKGAIAEGETKDEAKANLSEVISTIAEARQEWWATKHITSQSPVSTGDIQVALS